MIKTNLVLDLLEKNSKPMNFNNIWDSIKNDVISSLKQKEEEHKIKTDLYMSMLEDENLIMIGENNWDLKNKYTISKQIEIEKTRILDEEDLVLEESDDTKELNLEILESEYREE